jgi:hypothetical protein
VKMEDEAELTSVELMRQTMAGSQFFRDHPDYDEENYDPGYGDEYEAADAAMEEAATEAMVKGRAEAVNSYLDRYGQDVTLAVHTLVNELANRATVLLMFYLQNKLGHLPTAEEMAAELDSDEWATLDGLS